MPRTTLGRTLTARGPAALLVLAILVSVQACGKDAPAAKSPPPAEVRVITIEAQPVANLLRAVADELES